MFRTIVKIGGSAFVLAIAAVALFLFKPWSPHTPWQFLRVTIPSQRVGVFTHWERIWPVDTIPASPMPRVYPRAVAAIQGVRYRYAGRERSVGDYMRDANVNGIMVLSDGKVVFENYRNGIGPDTRHTLWSAAKSYAVTMLGIAVREGRIRSIDDSVETYAPQFKGTAYGKVSLRHVAMMASGVRFFHFSGSPDRRDMYLQMVQGADLDDFAAALSPRIAPGTDFNYLATDTQVLTAAIRGAYGHGYAAIIADRLWRPAGFTGDATWSKHADGPQGVNYGHCCLQVRLMDFAHLGQLYLDDLKVRGRPLAPDGWVDLVSRPSADFQEPGDRARGYAMQFWVPNGHDAEFMALGAFGQILWIDRARKVVVAQVAAHGDSPPSEAEENAVFRAIVAAAVNRRTAAPTPRSPPPR